ncbi:hypothetical protein [Lacticaseibacillus songhuajiangensis]|uniref:hypothetical protein n=1 Tax=Lacticaseibacillus songhuajiangensis TaxID=1296539 RepID=UPI000F78AEC9|nr:hypothetical protein [Lacticaseibacillus songhuajiangensis]
MTKQNLAFVVLTRKHQIPFYQACYRKLGYEIGRITKSGRNYELEILQSDTPLKTINQDVQQIIEQKLRLIEVTDRKKCGFNALFLNLSAHVALFCIQAAIFYTLNVQGTHATEMLQVGVLLFLGFLLAGFALKMLEIYRWNVTTETLKQQVRSSLADPRPVRKGKSEFTISVLFTRNHNRFSNLIYWTSGRQYTHASLGLGEQTDAFYSFSAKGFREEHPAHRPLFDGRKESLCYQFTVPEADYHRVQSALKHFAKNKQIYRYNMLGAILSVFHIYLPSHSKKIYFCSEFVSNQLRHLKSFNLKRSSTVYLPTNLAKALIKQPNLSRVLVDEV